MATVTSTNIMSTLGAGSGVDTKSLAENLANAEIQPRKDLINNKITKTEASISGMGYIKAALTDLKSAFAKLDDATDFASITASNTQPNAVGVTTTSAALAGSFSVEVSQLARAQRTASNGFAARNTALNNGSSFNLNLSVNGGTATAISVRTDTPAGVVSAINGANLGVTAQLLQTGDAQAPYTIVLTGESGAAKNFSLTADNNQLQFASHLQTAADAQLKVNGLSISRSSNQISDLVDGVTLDLYTTTSTAARVDLNRETTAIKDGFKALVTAYNDLEATLKVLGDPKSTIEDVGGSLNGDSILQSVRYQVRRFITDESSTKGSTIQAARNAGLNFDRNGQLTLDEAKLDLALQNNFDETVKTFTAGTNNKSMYSAAPAGVAGDAVVKLDQMLRSTGLLASRTVSATKQVTNYKEELSKLDDQLSRILERYTQQFSLMDSIVGESNSLRSSLKSTFANMSGNSSN